MARAGRFGKKGLAITFVSGKSASLDAWMLNEVQERFEVKITEFPEEIDPSLYSK